MPATEQLRTTVLPRREQGRPYFKEHLVAGHGAATELPTNNDQPIAVQIEPVVSAPPRESLRSRLLKKLTDIRGNIAANQTTATEQQPLYIQDPKHPHILLTSNGGYVDLSTAHPNNVWQLAQQGYERAQAEFDLIREVHTGRHRAVRESTIQRNTLAHIAQHITFHTPGIRRSR